VTITTTPYYGWEYLGRKSYEWPENEKLNGLDANALKD
jgi:hypothetical protein